MKNCFESSDIDLSLVEKTKVESIAPWTIKPPKVVFDLSWHKKSETSTLELTSTLEFQTFFKEIIARFEDYKPVYTDGSKDDEKVAAAFVADNTESKFRLPDNASIFSAEIKAIDLALDYIAGNSYSKHIIFSDSLSVLQSLRNCSTKNALIKNTVLTLYPIRARNRGFAYHLIRPY